MNFARLSTYSFNRYPDQASQLGVFLTDRKGDLDPSSVIIKRLSEDDLLTRELVAILESPLIDDDRWMCSPVYRDALMFFDRDNRVVSILNICLECDNLMTDRGLDISLDNNAYPKLKAWLKKLGHPVEELNMRTDNN
ncbi:hypothetical protein [Hymenobacter daecheongensis]|uniref:hypothetical protein n=1 Tax=Hymenobacter daecheongensis TaxID=496053 RepID=UPI0011612D75|nr:hypothetical protein [Hymenobacter daecheongensis]